MGSTLQSLKPTNLLESGLARAYQGGLCCYEKEGCFSLQQKKVQPYSESFPAKRRSVDKLLKDVEEMLGSPSAEDVQPSTNDLKYSGFSKEQYEQALDRYQS